MGTRSQSPRSAAGARPASSSVLIRRIVLAVVPLMLVACDVILTDPAPPTADVTIQFQVAPAPLGRSGAAFTRVDRVALRFVRPDESFRDTILPLRPADGIARARISLTGDERVPALGIGAQLRSGTSPLFEGGAIVDIVPGEPATAEIPLNPIPAAVVATDETTTLLGVGAGRALESAVLYATGDTIPGPEGVWTSEDETIVSVSPAGLAVAQRLGTTRLTVALDTLIDTVTVEVLAPPSPSGVLNRWINAEGGLWTDSANWSLGRPPLAGDSVEITLAGIYSILVDATPPPLEALVLGALSGAQTLLADTRILTVAEDLTLGAGAVLDLTSTSVTAGGVVTQAGSTLRLAGGSSLAGATSLGGLLVTDDGAASVSGPITTAATSTIRLGGVGTAGALVVTTGLTNNGTLEIGGGAELTVTGGSLVNAPGGSVTSLANALVGDATVTASLNNQGTIILDRGLRLEAAGAAHVNGGSITLASGSNLVVADAASFEHSGTLDASAGSVDFGFTGTGAGLTTSGSISIGAARELVVRYGPFDQTGGTIAGGGLVRLVDLPATMSDPMTLGATGPTFLELERSVLTASGLTVADGTSLLLNASTFDGEVLEIQGQLDVIGQGASTVGTSVLTASTSEIRVTGGAAGSPSLAFTGGFTNSGALILANSLAGAGATVTVPGVLVNGPTGVIASEPGLGGGVRRITAQIDNQGFVSARHRLDIDAPNATHVNSGTYQTDGAGPLVVSGADAFTNDGEMHAATGPLRIALTGAGPGFINTGTMTVADGLDFIVSGGTVQMEVNMGGAGTLRLVQATVDFASPVILGQTGPDNLALEQSSAAIPGLTVDPGTQLSIVESVVSGDVDVQGTVVAQGSSSLTASLTTAPTGDISVVGRPGAPAVLTVPGSFTNNGLLTLTGSGVGPGDSELAIVNGSLTNGSTGTIRSDTGSAGGARTVAAGVSNIGSVRVDAPLTVTGQLVDPVGAASSYSGNGSTLTVSGLDVDGAVFDNVPLATGAGPLTAFNNATFQNMDPTVSQLTVEHPGLALPFVMVGLTFSTAPTSGYYIEITDSDGILDLLTVQVLASSPLTGLARSLLSGGAILIW